MLTGAGCTGALCVRAAGAAGAAASPPVGTIESGAFASAAWIAGTVLFAWYVRNFGHYDEMYGNLGAVVGFLTWIWLSLVVLLLGAEINSEIERRRGA